MKKDTYFTITIKDIEEAYVVTGYDIASTPGVMFISMDPTFIRNDDAETVVPVTPKTEEEDCPWLTGDFEEEIK